jgi:N-acetylmuramoyl-L-alanine amidase
MTDLPPRDTGMNSLPCTAPSVPSFWRPAGVALLALLLLSLAGPLLAQEEGNDLYLDPLAFKRVDEVAAEVPLTVKLETTGETRMVQGRYLLAGSREMYLSSSVAGGILKASRFWQSRLRRLEMKIGETSFVVTGNTRVVVSGEQESLLPVPVLDHEGDLWLPMVLLTDVMGPRLSERVAWDAETRQLELGSAEYNLTRLRVEQLGRTTAVHVHCSEPLGFRASSPRPGVVELKVYGAQADVGKVGTIGRRGLLRSARCIQYSDHAVVTLVVDDLVGRYRTYTAAGGKDIVVVLEEEQVAALPPPVPRGHESMNIEQGPLDVTRRIAVRTVVVDPGHGGHDAGAVGTRGILEKNVNLGVARELKRYLERESDIRVVLTRDRDTYLDLAERAEIANSAHGDLFISLHCNSWFNDGAHGFETFFLSPAESDYDKSVEAAENASAGAGAEAGDPDDVEFIVWELVQNQFISSSSQLAEVVQQHVVEDLSLHDRGVRQAGFRVLVGAYMPAILIEMGFLTHAEEEGRLGSNNFQRRLARSLGEAVLVYRDQMDLTAREGAGAGDGTETQEGEVSHER